MPTGVDVSCLYSTIKNSSGASKFFGFLPPHGRRLAADEEFTNFGSILEALGSDIDRAGNTGARISFERAVARGDLEIVQTPSPILESDDGYVQMLKLQNDGTLAAVTPCWNTSFSDSDTVTLDNS